MRTVLVLLVATRALAGCGAVHTAHNVARSTVHGTATAVRGTASVVKAVAHGTAMAAHGTATVLHGAATATEAVAR